MIKVAIIGDGGWGTTLAILLNKKGYDIGLWGAFPDYSEELKRTRQNTKFLPGVKIPETVEVSSDLGRVLNSAKIVILAIPTKFLRGALERLRTFDFSHSIIVSAAKGIENKTLMRPSEIVKDVLGKIRLVVLTGPTISYEVVRNVPTSVVVASKDEKAAKEVQDLLMTDRFRVYTSNDVVGAELGGALKNIIAIAAGICDGLGFGANTKAALVTRGLVEITRLGTAMGAKKETFAGLSGMGDLITTCISSHGRNRWLGEEIGKGKKLQDVEKTTEMVVEGVATAKSAYELAKKYKVEMPITTQVYHVLYDGKDPRRAVADLMMRERKAE